MGYVNAFRSSIIQCDMYTPRNDLNLRYRCRETFALFVITQYYNNAAVVGISVPVGGLRRYELDALNNCVKQWFSNLESHDLVKNKKI